MEIETILITHFGWAADSVYLVRDRIEDRLTLRKLRRLPAMWMRGRDDVTGSGNDLYCPGCIIVKRPDGYAIAWELQRWSSDPENSPIPQGKVPGWRHLIDAGFRVTALAEVASLVGPKVIKL